MATHNTFSLHNVQESLFLLFFTVILQHVDCMFRSSDGDDLLVQAGEHVSGLQRGGAEGRGGRRAGHLRPGHPARWHRCKVSQGFWLKTSICSCMLPDTGAHAHTHTADMRTTHAYTHFLPLSHSPEIIVMVSWT